MIPGMAQFKDQLANFDDREIDRIRALILSMTPTERRNPKIIDGSRRSRIAKGAGRSVSDVNQLVDRFFEARKMMMSMAGGGGMPGMAGIPGMGGKRAKARQQATQSRKKRGSGNPAKRAADARRVPAAQVDSANGVRQRSGSARRRRRPQESREGFEGARATSRTCSDRRRSGSSGKFPGLQPLHSAPNLFGSVAGMSSALRVKGTVLPSGEQGAVRRGRPHHVRTDRRRRARGRGMDRRRSRRRALPRRS